LVATFSHTEFPLGELLARKEDTVTVVLPAKETASTIGMIVERLRGLHGLVDQVLVVDAASQDGTAEVALAAGADVRQESELMPEFGPVRGKGDAMWRSLAAASGDVVAYFDSDSLDFPLHFVTGLVGPLIARDAIQFVKGAFERPFLVEGREVPRGGGRVTELMARPLLSAFYPELASFVQPLAGEVAARRGLFERIPFGSGYAIEIAMLIDVYREAGIGAMAQVDIGERRNRHQPLQDLGAMAYTILSAVLERVHREGRLGELPRQPFRRADGQVIDVHPVERPPFASLRSPA
jgi:glucosyl-3-phosphoglycerate synthase